MGAKKKPLDTVGIGDVGIEAERVGEQGSRVICGEFAAPPQKAAGTIIEDEDTAATVEQIVAWLHERKLI
jgi:electron transfer flavoprotein beta subunit